MRRRSSLVAVAVGVLAALAPAGVAFADPAGPTDYASRITAITPAVPGITAEMAVGQWADESGDATRRTPAGAAASA